ncbi:MAG: DUF2628 domain-containing protein [Rickettsiales bacterium]
MFEKVERIYNAYEKPELAEPTARMELVRDGVNIWALVLHVFWLVYHRMWWVLVGYIALAACLSALATVLHLPESAVMVLQLALQVMLCVHASELRGWTLQRKGYRFAGVLVADSEMKAQRRYYEHVS